MLLCFTCTFFLIHSIQYLVNGGLSLETALVFHHVKTPLGSFPLMFWLIIFSIYYLDEPHTNQSVFLCDPFSHHSHSHTQSYVCLHIDKVLVSNHPMAVVCHNFQGFIDFTSCRTIGKSNNFLKYNQPIIYSLFSKIKKLLFHKLLFFFVWFKVRK